MCGYIFTPLTPEAMQAAQKQQRKSSLWLALIPAFLTLGAATGFVVYSGAQFHKVSVAIAPGGSCVECRSRSTSVLPRSFSVASSS